MAAEFETPHSQQGKKIIPFTPGETTARPVNPVKHDPNPYRDRRQRILPIKPEPSPQPKPTKEDNPYRVRKKILPLVSPPRRENPYRK